MSTKVIDYWECKRCRINSKTKDRMCPCPRGSCEAEVTGREVITTESTVIKFPKEKK